VSIEMRPNRTLGGVHDQFWDHCAQGQLWLQRCGNCSEYQWPPEEHCEKCGDSGLEWVEVSGQGELVSWCTFVQKYYEPLDVPYDTILVRLSEGPLFISNPDGFGLDQAKLGTKVEVLFRDCQDSAGEFRLPVFRLVES
jgi:uncharacterized protein